MILSNVIKQAITDKHGRIVIWQSPNLLLWLWLILKILTNLVNDSSFKADVSIFSKAVLFTWAYLEITAGDSLFRRTLGMVVITFTVLSFFR
jgi:hypothetical protein